MGYWPGDRKRDIAAVHAALEALAITSPEGHEEAVIALRHLKNIEEILTRHPEHEGEVLGDFGKKVDAFLGQDAHLQDVWHDLRGVVSRAQRGDVEVWKDIAEGDILEQFELGMGWGRAEPP